MRYTSPTPPRHSLDPKKSAFADSSIRGDGDGGFMKRDIIRFFAVDIILIIMVRLMLWLGIFKTIEHYIFAMLASKVVLFLYLLWLVRERRDAWSETGGATAGRWWAWPVAIILYAGFYPVLIYINRANDALMLHLHEWLGWTYEPGLQEILLLIFEDVVDSPLRMILVFFTVFFGPVMEEIAFRGVGLDAYKRSAGMVWAVVLTSLLFGLYHFSLKLVIPLSALGAMFAVVRIMSRSLWCGVFIHCLHNAVTLCLLAYQLGLFERFIPKLPL